MYVKDETFCGRHSFFFMTIWYKSRVFCLNFDLIAFRQNKQYLCVLKHSSYVQKTNYSVNTYSILCDDDS